MIGDGFIRDGDANDAFAFVVREKANGADRGAFALRVTDCDRGNNTSKKKTKPRDDQFIARSYTNVVFSDDPSIRPGRRHRPQVDTVTIYDSASHVVVQLDDELAGGNVQSVRLRH